MNEGNVIEMSGREAGRDELTEVIRMGARKLIAQGLEVEVSELLARFCGAHDEARSCGGGAQRLPA